MNKLFLWINKHKTTLAISMILLTLAVLDVFLFVGLLNGMQTALLIVGGIIIVLIGFVGYGYLAKRSTEQDKSIIEMADDVCNSVYLWCRNLLKNHGLLLFAIVITILALAVRYSFSPYPSNDLLSCIFPWIRNFRSNGHLAYLKVMQGDYPPFYMTILALISYLPAGPLVNGYGLASKYPYYLYDMLYVKTLSFAFDILLAIGVYKIVKMYNKENKILPIAAYAVALFLPTVFVNSGFWGQCDGMYVGLVVWCVYYALQNKSLPASIFLGFALAHKLQTIFIIPFLGYLWLRNRFKLRYLLVTLAVVFITFLPCYMAGAPFVSPFEKYGTLTIEYPKPNYNSGSLYTFIQDIFWYKENDVSTEQGTYNLIHYGGIFFGLAITVMALIIIYKKNVKPTKESLPAIAALFAMLMPFVLPHMHERYFYMGEVMVMIYCLTTKKRYWLIPVVQLSGMITYMPYIFNSQFMDTFGTDGLRIATLLNFVVIYTIFKDILKCPRYQDELEDLDVLEEATI